MTHRKALADMLAATRLTREGRLHEASALLQRALQGEVATGAPQRQAADADVIDVPYRERDDAGHAEADAAAARAADSTATFAQPQQLREILQRFTRPGKAKPLHAPSTGDLGPGQFIDGEFSNAAGTRRYKLYIPSTHAGAPLPLIVMLHGCTQSPEDFAAGTRMNLLAERTGFLVLYPAQSNSANTNGCWNWFKREEQARGRGEPSLLAGMTRDVMQRYAVDAQRVYAAGLSAGGAMAAVLAVTYPDLFAAVGIHSGLACGAARDLPSALAAMRGTLPDSGNTSRSRVPTIVFHGDRDGTVHPSNGAQVIDASDAHQPNARVAEQERGRAPGGHAYTRTVHRDADGTAVLEHWVVHGGGHAWFGGSPAGSYCDPRGPDASAEISRFLLAHRL